MSLEVLSQKQQEILKLCAAGLSSPEMAEQLCLSPKTVRNQLSMIYDKLGVQNRVQAAIVYYAENQSRDG